MAAFVASRLATARRQTGADPDHQDLTDFTQRAGIGLSHIAVALGTRKGRQRVHQMHDIGIQRGLVGECREQPIQRLRKIGEQAALDRLGQLDQGCPRR